MKERDISKIIFSEYGYSPIKKYNKQKESIGFDTETETGKAFLIGYHSKTENNILSSTNPDEILSFLCNYKFTDSLNFFYNINYDFQAIIKTLPLKNIKELQKLSKTNYNKYKISYLPNKSFSISIANHKIKFFDLMQFYNYNSLNNSAEKFLGMNKLNLKDDGIDIANLSYDKYKNDISYKHLLNKYLYRDCEITYLLGNKLTELLSPYLNPKNLYSQASISEQYYLENLTHKMYLPSKNILQYALNSYQGGRFEVFKRGHFYNAHIYDIKSAYPYHNIDVPNVSNGEWKKINDSDDDALIGLYKIKCEVDDIKISPMKYQLKNNCLIYPIGKFEERYVNKKELNLLKKLDVKYTILDGYEFYDNEPEYPYTFLKKFYDLKEKYKKENQKELSWIPKIVINGFYGKTIQVNPSLSYSKEKLENKEIEDFIINEETKEVIFAYKDFKAGKLFNPIVANEITANTRTQLYESVIKHENKIIGFQTDSIITEKPIPLKMDDKIGSWELENKGEMLILGSGVYELIGNKNKTRMRGFGKKLDLNDLLILNKTMDEIKIKLTRNFKLKSTFKMKNRDDKILTDDDKYNLFNQIANDIKIVNINFDKKRIWDRDFINCKDILDSQIESNPIKI